MRGYRPGPPPEPKPFFWIPVRNEKLNAIVSHESFTGLNGLLDLELKVISDFLYVGSGSILLDQRDRAYYSFARRGDLLTIPASGIKGSIRAIIEAISGSCVSQMAKKDNFYSSSGRCEIGKNQESKASLCAACRLFGTTGYRGRVYLSDAKPKGEIKTEIIKISDLWPPKQAIGRKFYQIKAFQRLDDRPEKNHRFLETVPKDSVFSTRLYFENTSPAEMSLVIRAIGLTMKIGGAKPRCLGAIKFDIKDLRLASTGSSGIFKTLSKGYDSQPLKDNLQKWFNDKSLLDEVAWMKFREGAKVQNDPCPRGMY